MTPPRAIDGNVDIDRVPPKVSHVLVHTVALDDSYLLLLLDTRQYLTKVVVALFQLCYQFASFVGCQGILDALDLEFPSQG